MRVVIAGAGIGGLTTALGMAAAGIRDVRVLEAVPRLRPLGVGIQLLPHAVRVLHQLGLAGRLHEAGVEVWPTSYFDRHGNLIGRFYRGGRQAGDDWPAYHIHRGHLQQVLVDQVRKELGESAIVTDSRVTGFAERDDRVAVTVAHRQAGGATVEAADLLVAADGVGSLIRSALYPDEGAPKWNGCLMWRGTVPWEESRYADHPSTYGGNAQQRFLSYPVLNPQGTLILNWAATSRVDEDCSEPTPQDWNRQVDKHLIQERYRGWRFGSMNLESVIERCDRVFEYPMVDRDPLPRWSFGRVTLLGDAAHPMYPTGSNGAAQAILDAEAISRAVETSTSVSVALRQYDAERIAATANVVRANRALADGRILQLVDERAPDGFDNIDDVISRTELEGILGEYKRVAGWGTASTATGGARNP